MEKNNIKQIIENKQIFLSVIFFLIYKTKFSININAKDKRDC